MSRKFNITNSSQLTLFATYKRIKLTSEDDIDITYDNIYHSHSEEAQDPDFVPTCDTTNLVSSDPIEETTLPSMAPTQLSISPEIPNVNLQPPLDIAQGPNDKPVQPNRHTCRFPLTLVGTKKRQFNPDWFVTFSWLEYSIERDAGFCYPCHIFNALSGRTEDAFKSVGFRDWKHATGRDGTLHCHDKCLTHINAMASWHEYK
ncbi:Zinc finger MYM-type protein 1-like [Oopsacas minuta]|uniref:Zinc finger MYM-type protein 1-like n=1 Tax=Oopsacas minuta TaxID=111878 RepID=A0AAV7KEQ2_9METZ|nr:Zinc finger MYM-type protein 1-like [Oopsacas minuta]